MPYKDPAKKKAYMARYNREYDFNAWNAANRDKTRANSAKHQAKHSENITRKRRERRQNDPVAAAKHAEHCHTRRARLRAQVCDCCTKQELYEFWVIAAAKTEETGIPHEVDHIEPLAKGGAHGAKNLRVITMRENRQKGAA